MPRRRKAIEIFLMPGECFVGDADYRPRTLLGSCVSITLWHRVRRIGAMSHFLLSTRGRRGRGMDLDGRYGDEAVCLMLEQLARCAVAPPDCEAKIFGGASMSRGSEGDALQVGRENGGAAHRLLRQHGIPIVSQSLYGFGHRNIIFDIGSGDVWARQIKLAAPAGSAA